MKVWITGIAGFLGSHLADTLIAEGHDVSGNDSFICSHPENAPDVIWCDDYDDELDCTNFDRMKEALTGFSADVVVHCAATAHEGLSNFSPSFITKNIYEASVATFSAAIASGVKRIVNMSSMSRYGRGLPPFNERNSTRPVDPYGIAKVAAEDTLIALCDLHEVRWAIAVPHNIIGTRQRSIDPYRNVAAIMINRCKQGKAPIIYGDGSQIRCFSPVADIIPSLIKMVEGTGDAEIINIGPDTGSITIESLARKIMKMTGFKGEPIYVPGRPNEVNEAICSSDKARRILGYKSVQGLDDCLQEMVDYIQPQDFVYDFPLEIISEITPKTWTDRII